MGDIIKEEQVAMTKGEITKEIAIQAKLFVKAKAGDLAAYNKLYVSIDRFIWKEARKFHEVYPDIEELHSIGSVSFMKSYNTFDISKGFTFLTYFSRVLTNDFLMELRRNKKFAKVISFNAPITFNDGNIAEFLDTLSDKVDYENKALLSTINEEIISHLNDRELKILSLSIDGKKQRDIACMLGLSQSYISRIAKRTQKKLIKHVSDQAC